MIFYSKYEKDRKTYIKELWWQYSKIWFFVGLISFLVGAWCLLWGTIYNDDDGKQIGSSAIILTVLLIIFCVKIHSSIRYSVEFLFYNVPQGGKVDFQLSIYENNVFEIINLHTGAPLTFVRQEIKKINFTKSLIVVELKLGERMFFPRIEQLEQLFKQFNG